MAGFTEFSVKDPDEVDRFTWRWADELGSSDTISTSAFTMIGDGVIDSSSNTTTTTTAVLSGGTAGQFSVHNRIVTANGRTLDKTFTVPVREQ
jgi:hypothetical protein